MAKISTYPDTPPPSLDDFLLGTDVSNGNATQNFLVSDFINLISSRPYKVYTALLTQSGGDTEVDLNAGDDILKGITYYINVNDNNGDFTQYGAPNNNVGTYFVCNQNGVIPESAQLYYNAGAPVVKVLENTIGNIWFQYYDVGTYLVNSNSLFTSSKSMATIGSTFSGVQNGGLAGVLPGGEPSFYIFTSLNFSTSDDELLNTPIEIRVYN